MLEVCFSAHPNIQYRAKILNIFRDVLKVILLAQLPHAGKYK